MANEKQTEQTLALFRSLVEQRKWPTAVAGAEADATAGGETFMAMTTPHPYYFVSGDAVLAGRLSGAETLAGYQSLVFQGDLPVGAPIAAPAGEEMSYVASWEAGAAEALNNALKVAEENGRDASDFAVMTVPEVGFSAVWLRDRHELIPMAITQTRSSLDPNRVYSEEEVIKLLHEPLNKRLSAPAEPAADYGPARPPTG